MSNWIGPNVYRIEAYSKRKVAITQIGDNILAKTGGSAEDFDQQDAWSIVSTGSGESGKDVFHLINVVTGKLLTSPSESQNHKTGVLGV
ncbi:hypothetical protein Q7P35_001287 [Cladosporium inversicolor]